jgi:hypothetical protein
VAYCDLLIAAAATTIRLLEQLIMIDVGTDFTRSRRLVRWRRNEHAGTRSMTAGY